MCHIWLSTCPIRLSCGHLVCESCRPAVNHNQIICKLYGQTNGIQLNQEDASSEVERLIVQYIKKLSEIIIEKYEHMINNANRFRLNNSNFLKTY